MKKIALLGSTGSIGQQTLNVVRSNPDKFKIVSIAGGYNAGLFVRQIEEFKPKVASLAVELNKDYILPKGTEFFCGPDAFTNAIIDEADIVVVALVGFKGIIAVLDAIKKGKNIALANKESLVVGGELVKKLASEKGISITPIDSEHSAIWQALDFDFNKPFKKIILTASGGAFRDLPVSELDNVKPRDALKHPNWKMGAKITVDCATLVNKSFEVAEAKWFYNTTYDKIDVIIHRESIIHSMVEFEDNSVISQMSYPTMELPIQLALDYPKRYKSSATSLDFVKIGKLTFEKVDDGRYPCFSLAVESLKRGGIYPAVLNGANEEAVRLFLQNKISFKDIYKVISTTLDAFNGSYDGTYESLETANDFAVKFVKNKFGE